MLKKTNIDLISKMKSMNLHLDELIEQKKAKDQIEDMRAANEPVVEEYECDHESVIERLKDLIKRKE